MVGVIGGLHQDGCEPWTSYGAPFGADKPPDLHRGGQGERTPVLPGPEGDGCTIGL